MDLATFVAETLNQITGGVEQAQAALGERQGVRVAWGTTTHAGRTFVDFDIAVTVLQQDEDKADAKGSVKAGLLSVVGFTASASGELSGATTSRHEEVSRVKFTIAIDRPNQISREALSAAAAPPRGSGR